MVQSLGHLPANDKWEFDASVTDCFEDMLARSIPQYPVMRDAVFHLGSSFVQPHTAIVDLGCSRGDALAPFTKTFPENNVIGIEVSQPMIDTVCQRFIKEQNVFIHHMDLRTEYPSDTASLTLSILTLQFTPIEYRQRIVRDVYKSLAPGGAFILVEKILGSTSELNSLMVKNYYNIKSSNGYSQEEIERKRLSLEGVLVPVTAKWNEELLKMAGFQSVDCFWRYLNFAGWIAVKE